MSAWTLLAALGGGLVLVSRKGHSGIPAATDPELAPLVDVRTLVRDEASSWLVPPEFAAAIVEKESAWNGLAVNQGPGDAARGGAWGLFQMTHLTALEQDDRNVKNGKHSRWRDVDPARRPESLLDVKANVWLGCSHLAHLQGQVKDLHEVAAAYNGGVAGRKRAGPQAYADDVIARMKRLEQAAARVG